MPSTTSNERRRVHEMEAQGLPTFGMPVSRFDIAEFVGDQFDGRAVSPEGLMDVAAGRGARPAVLLTLRRLSGACYHRLDELWVDLPTLPDVYDPWAAAASE